jgi:putative ABC transport system permease protein
LALVGIATGFEHSFLQLYEGAGIDLIVVRAGGRQRLNSALDEKLGDKMLKRPGVKDVLPGLADVVSFQEQGLFSVIVQGWRAETSIFDHIYITKGRGLKARDERKVLLGTVLAQNLEKSVGDSVDVIEREPFEVVGIYESSNIFENGAMVIPLKQLQRIMDRPGQVTGFSLVLTPYGREHIDEVRRDVLALADNLSCMTTQQHVNSLTEIQLAKGMAFLTSIIALLIGAFGIMNTMVMSVHERTREIGTLRAVGWRKSRVFKMVLFEAIVLSLVGALVGTLLSFALLAAITRIPSVNGLIEYRVSPALIGAGFLIAIVVGVLGGVLPAQRAARMLPLEALRHD